MADRVDSGSRRHLSPPPHQISKDGHGFDNSIPLSPQWLLPKPAESKPGVGAGGNCINQHMPYGTPSDMLNLPGNSEEMHEIQKKKNVFRPSMFDSESSRRDRWRDEERDTRSSAHKDRWRDGEKDIGDNRRGDRRIENSSARHFGDTRRMTSERWGDSSSRDTNYDQRRESKWNTRWGPDDRGFEGSREKLSESGKYDTHLDKVLLNYGKDEREEEQTRSWRSNLVQGRGRADSAHNQSVIPNKQLCTVSRGRGRGENTQLLFSHGRGWVGSGGSSANVPSHSQPQRPYAGELDSGHGEPNPLSYSRTKLLDLYRATNLTALRKSVGDFVQVPPITLDEPLNPLALCAPNSEEMTILKGIEKGDLTVIGAPQVTKDTRNLTDSTYARRGKLGSSTVQGSREDLSFPYDECKDGSSEGQGVSFLNYSEEALGERFTNRTNSNIELVDGFRDEGPHKTTDEVSTSRELSLRGSKICQSLGEGSNGFLHDSREISSDIRQRKPDMGWPRQSKDPHNHLQGHMIASSDNKGLPDWKNSEDPIMKRQLSGVLDREVEARKILQTSPEELSLLYKDPQGQIQGPFKGIDIIGWFEAGYFGIDLPVCLDGVLGNSPWSTLGDVMPHLRVKARPPPGFSVPKQNEYVDVQNWLNSSPLVSNHSGLTEFEMLRNDASYKKGSKTEAENRFLESLMSSNVSSSPLNSLASSEGFQGYVGNNPGNMMQPVVDNGNNVYLMTKRMALERQRSLTNPYAYWTGKDAASLVSKPECVSETLAQQAKLKCPSLDDNAHQKHPQNADMMPILQGLPDRPPSGINNVAPGWSNFPVQGGLESLQNKVDIAPQVPFGFQQQRQQQNQLLLSNLLAPGIDNPSTILTAEKLLSAGLPQDQQLLNMLQQQYLLSQASMPTQQISPLDKMALLKHQQLLRQQQQQQLLSQVISEHQSHQRFGQLQVGGMMPLDPSQLQQMKEAYHTVSHASISGLQDASNSNNMVKVPSKYVQEVSQNVVSEPSSLHLPHHVYESTSQGKGLDTTLLEPLDILHHEGSLPTSKIVENLSLREITNESKLDNSFSVDPTDAAAFSEGRKNPLSFEDIPSKIVENLSLYEKTNGSKLENTSSVDPATAAAVSEVGNSTLSMEVLPSKIVENLSLHELKNRSKLENSISVDPSVAAATSEAGKNLVSVEVIPSALAASTVDSEVLPSTTGDTTVLKGQLNDSIEKPKAEVKKQEILSPVVVEVLEPKKFSNKKSKKQKSSKSQSVEIVKVALQQTKQLESEKWDGDDSKSVKGANEEALYGASLLWNVESSTKQKAVMADDNDATFQDLSDGVSRGNIENIGVEDYSRIVDSASSRSSEPHTGQRAWKPAPGMKPKSLLEIQMEEQMKAQTNTSVSESAAPVNATALPTPWSGVFSNPDSVKVSHEGVRGADNNVLQLERSGINHGTKSKASHLHDLLAEEVLKKSGEGEAAVADSTFHVEPVDDDNFIEAKDTKRSRKKSAKSKNAAAKAVTTVSVDLPLGSSPNEKSKSSRISEQDKQELPPIPAGPSLGDFVIWKGEPNSSPSPSPAWSTDSNKVSNKPSLRDILKEQQYKKGSSTVHQIQIPIPQKPQPAPAVRSAAALRSVPASSPPKDALPLKIDHPSSQSKYKADDELFWGPVEQSRQETNQFNFPHLASQGSWDSKVASSKGISLSRKKSSSIKSTERLLSSSPAGVKSSSKGKRDVMTKHSEAMGFKNWCENECVRLIGTKDTSFLEYCLTQSRSEAEMLLKQNLGSHDHDCDFIDKFLNYMEMLPSDVIEMAFPGETDQKFPPPSAVGTESSNADNHYTDLGNIGGQDGVSKGGGKKKSKKGKKINPSALGFSVVSNRIMMGEIQTLEE